MDEFTDELCTVTDPYTGPIIRVPDLAGTLRRLRHNTAEMRAGRYDPAVTRRLLLDYLRDSEKVLYSPTRSTLFDVTRTLLDHTLAMPHLPRLDDDQEWVEERDAWLLFRRCWNRDLRFECDYGTVHLLDDLAFLFRHDWELCSIGYFCQPSPARHGVWCRVGPYERCRCGRWFRGFRPLATAVL